MSLRLQIKGDHPNARHIARAADLIRAGGLAVYPTDGTYGLGCNVFSKRSVDRIYRLKGMQRSQPLAFLCSDISQVSRFAYIDTRNYRVLRHHLPGAYTFVLPATRDVPKVLQTRRNTVGIRIPSNPAAIALVQAVGHPLVTTTVAKVNEDDPEGAKVYLNDPQTIEKEFGRSIEVLLDAGALHGEPTTMVDLTRDRPVILRPGAGDTSWLQID